MTRMEAIRLKIERSLSTRVEDASVYITHFSQLYLKTLWLHSFWGWYLPNKSLEVKTGRQNCRNFLTACFWIFNLRYLFAYFRVHSYYSSAKHFDTEMKWFIYCIVIIFIIIIIIVIIVIIIIYLIFGIFSTLCKKKNTYNVYIMRFWRDKFGGMRDYRNFIGVMQIKKYCTSVGAGFAHFNTGDAA